MRKLPPVAQHFVEEFGLALASEGLSRTAGRLLGLILMLDDGGDLDFLATELHVSRASVSTNTRLLESIGAIERHSIPGRRRIVYRAAKREHDRAMEAILMRMRRTLDVVAGARRELPREMSGAKVRLQRVANYYQRNIVVIEAALAHRAPRSGVKRRRSS
jgi:DNA-binding transcriptional regulator GbsR (MarR family)